MGVIALAGYSIGQIVQATGLSERQIRYCERKGLIKPLRSKGGHRLFNEQELAFLTQLAKERRQGMSLNKAMQSLGGKAQKPQSTCDNLAVRLFFGLAAKERRL